MAALNEQVRRFLAAPRFGVLATLNADGSPQQTVIWYLLRGDEILMNTKRGRQKDRNLDRDDRASLCVEDDYRYVAINGTIAFDDDPQQAQRDIEALAVRYHGPERAAKMVRDQFRKEARVTFRLSIERVDVHGFDANEA
ncbi:MAG TPA: PPOX class F420-dependent oxidoreductase [Thermomicrobiales bacterium]|nr:PPOX class F420-dependent oxidoreductase [Thermomicrobiales bacterium]